MQCKPVEKPKTTSSPAARGRCEVTQALPFYYSLTGEDNVETVCTAPLQAALPDLPALLARKNGDGIVNRRILDLNEIGGQQLV